MNTVRKRILINASIYNGRQNGLGIYCEQVYKQLSSIDQFEIVFYSFSRLSPQVTDHREIKFGLLQKIFSLGSVSLYRVLWNLILLPIHARKYDLVYSLSPHGSFFGKNQIITVHDLIGLNHNTGLFQRLYYKFLLPGLLNNSARIVTISLATEKILTEYYGQSLSEKVHTIYNGVDHLSSIEPVKPSFEVPALYDLVVGASYPHKNLARIIEIYQKLLTNRNLIVVCAENAYTTSLKQKIAKEGIANISFLHNLGNEELSWIYKNAVVHLYLTLEEGFGFPPFEAALYGTTSIISDIPCLKEIYEDTLPMVDPKDLEKIANCIRSFQKEDDFLPSVTERSKKFKWEVFRSNWIDFITSLPH